MRGPTNCGVGTRFSAGACIANPTQISTTNAVYQYQGELSGGSFTVSLIERKTAATSDTLDLYTYVGDPTANLAATTSNTLYRFNFTFSAAAAPIITAISPTSGPKAGGTSLTLTGTGFTGATSVLFGNTAANTFTVVNDTTLVVSSPAGAVGATDVTVATPAGSDTRSAAFTYTASTDAALTNLVLSQGTLAPGFASGTTAYTASVPNSQTSITVTPTNTGAGTITVNASTVASGSASAAIALAVGSNTISVVSTAEDGVTTKTYTVTVTRQPPAQSSDATLSSLTITKGTLTPGFASGITSYSASVAYADSSVYVTPTMSVSGTLTVNGTATPSASQSGQIPLSVGTNTITIVTLAQDGTTKTYTVTVERSAALIGVTPAAGALSTAVVAQAYSQTIAASGGNGNYSFIVAAGSLPSGLSLQPSGVLGGTPTTSGTFNFTIKASDSDGASTLVNYSLTVSGASSGSDALSNLVLSQGVLSPGFDTSVRSYTASVPYNTTSLMVTPTATGTPSITVNGVATTSGSASSPISLNIGSNVIMVSMTPTSGTVAVYTLNVTRAAAVIAVSPAAGALPSASRSSTYSQSIVASGGSAPYSFVVASGSTPTGITLSTTGELGGVPTSSGSYTFSVRVTDVLGSSVLVNYSLQVNSATTMAMSPASGALKNASAEVRYDQAIVATGGVGSVTYSVVSGSLPNGLTLDTSTGHLGGTPSTDSVGHYSFGVQARDSGGATVDAAYTLTVAQSAVSAADQQISVAAGETPGDVLLTSGATGGPFSGATLISVQPANAGSAEIVKSAGVTTARARVAVASEQFYLRFKPSSAFSGVATVAFSLTSSLGTSNTAKISYSVALDRSQVAAQMDHMVRSFVQTRQALLTSTISIPGLLERRRLVNGGSPVNTNSSPDMKDLSINFSTSLAQIDASRIDKNSPTAYVSPRFNAWASGTYLRHGSDEHGSRKGNFGLISSGMDVLVTSKDLVGWSFHYDTMTDPTDEDAKLTGHGWLTGPYMSSEIATNVFLDNSLLFGGSSNDINSEFFDGRFDTRRWLFDSRLTGIVKLAPATDLTPELRFLYLNESVDDYYVSNAQGERVDVKGFSQKQLRVSGGGKIQHRVMVNKDLMLAPSLGAKIGVSGLDYDSLFTTITAGLGILSTRDWDVDTALLLNLDDRGQRSMGASANVSYRF
jgi:hypothetical protein